MHTGIGSGIDTGGKQRKMIVLRRDEVRIGVDVSFPGPASLHIGVCDRRGGTPANEYFRAGRGVVSPQNAVHDYGGSVFTGDSPARVGAISRDRAVPDGRIRTVDENSTALIGAVSRDHAVGDRCEGAVNEVDAAASTGGAVFRDCTFYYRRLGFIAVDPTAMNRRAISRDRAVRY